MNDGETWLYVEVLPFSGNHGWKQLDLVPKGSLETLWVSLQMQPLFSEQLKLFYANRTKTMGPHLEKPAAS